MKPRWPNLNVMDQSTREENDNPCTSANIKFSALDRAKELQQNLSQQLASCVKLLRGIDISDNSLILPRKFCDEHFPMREGHHNVVSVIFVSEDEQEYRLWYSKYARKFALGWNEFSSSQSLAKGDALVFHLIENFKFKVYIVRSCRSTEVCEVNGSQNLDNHDKPSDTGIIVTVKEESLEPPVTDVHQKKRLKSNCTPAADQADDSDKHLATDVHLGTIAAESTLDFKDVKSFEDFKIIVHGQILGSVIPALVKFKYYELCRSQNTFLHDPLKQSGRTLVAGMILDTIKIAEATKSASVLTPLRDLESWDKTLKAFEDLGMAVGFLRARIEKLAEISRKQKAVTESKDAKSVQVEGERKALQEMMLELDELTRKVVAHGKLVGKMEGEFDSLKEENEKLVLAFMEVADSQW